MTKIAVNKICITIGRKTVELTPAELRELREVLDEMFPKQRVDVPIVIDRRPYWEPRRFWKTPEWSNSSMKGSGKTLSLTCNRT